MIANLRSKYLVPVVAAIGSLTALSVWAVNPASSITTLGETLEVRIDSPLDGATVPQGALTVTGRTGLPIATGNFAVTYIVDFSGSTSASVGDCNGDGVVNELDDVDASSANGSVLDCELIGVAALNNSLAAVPGISAGLIAFDSSAAARDVDPVTAGIQTFTAPAADADSNGVRDIPQAGRLLAPSGGTNFNVALAAMNVAFGGRPAGEQHVAFFLSDGVGTLSTGAGTPLAAAVTAGTRVFTYSVGPGATGCDVGDGLRTIADMTGGTCTEVINPAALTTMLTGTTPTGITKVEVSVDGGPVVPASLDALGNFSANVNLSLGAHQILATTFATDGTTATADISVTADNSVPSSGADLIFDKTASASSVPVGTTFSYTLAVFNNGAGVAGNVVVTDTLPTAVSHVNSIASQGGCAELTGTVTCNLGSLAAGASAFVSITVSANTAGIVANTASVASSSPDPNPGNNSRTVSVTILNANTDLSIQKTSGQNTVLVGDNITYNLVVGNAGPNDATGVVVTDSLPPSTSFVSGGATQGTCSFSAPTGTCNLGTIPNGGFASITLVVKANASGPVVNGASVRADQPDPVSVNNASTKTVTANRRATRLIAKPAGLALLSGSLLQVNLRFEARLTEGTIGIPGKPIGFVVGSQGCVGITNANGTAVCSLNLPRLLAVTLNFGYFATFAGDATYLPSLARGPHFQVLGIPLF